MKTIARASAAVMVPPIPLNVPTPPVDMKNTVVLRRAFMGATNSLMASAGFLDFSTTPHLIDGTMIYGRALPGISLLNCVGALCLYHLLESR